MTPYTDVETSRTFCGRCGHPMHFRECGANPESTGGPCQCRNDVWTLDAPPGSLFEPLTPPNLGAPEPRKCRHPKARRLNVHWCLLSDGTPAGLWHAEQPHTGSEVQRCEPGVICTSCYQRIDPTRARRGRQSRNYGNRAELSVARTYGGRKVGHAGGPVDVRGKEFSTQVKTHRRLPPLEWRKAFAGMVQSEGIPRLLLRFVVGAGLPTEDFIVVPGKAWLEWFGKDEDGNDGGAR